jgi:hypothetical protein
MWQPQPRPTPTGYDGSWEALLCKERPSGKLTQNSVHRGLGSNLGFAIGVTIPCGLTRHPNSAKSCRTRGRW